jgi:hypothetical protein
LPAVLLPVQGRQAIWVGPRLAAPQNRGPGSHAIRSIDSSHFTVIDSLQKRLFHFRLCTCILAKICGGFGGRLLDFSRTVTAT